MGFGRLVSIINWSVSGSMLIYQRVIYAQLQEIQQPENLQPFGHLGDSYPDQASFQWRCSELVILKIQPLKHGGSTSLADHPIWMTCSEKWQIAPPPSNYYKIPPKCASKKCCQLMNKAAGFDSDPSNKGFLTERPDRSTWLFQDFRNTR